MNIEPGDTDVVYVLTTECVVTVVYVMSQSTNMLSLTWKELIPRIADQEKAIGFCREYGLIPDEQPKKCVNCGADACVTLWKRPERFNFPLQFVCKKCRKRSSITINTWFHNSRLSIEESIILIACWVRNFTLEETAAECNVSVNTVCDFYGFCREVCYVIVTNDSVPIGGENKIVEIDESHLRTRKYRKGRLLKK